MNSVKWFTLCALVVSLVGCSSGQMRLVKVKQVDGDLISEVVGAFNQGPGKGVTAQGEEPASGKNGSIDAQSILSNTILKVGTVKGTLRYRVVGSGNKGFTSIETISDASMAKTLIGDYEAGLQDGQQEDTGR